MKRAELYISSLTGNTRKLAGALIEELRNSGYKTLVCSTENYLKENRDGLKENNKQEEQVKSLAGLEPVVIVCFWCRKASLDPLSLELLHRLEGRQIAAFGTMGSYPDSPYGERVRKSVSAAVRERNRCLGVYLCRGQIDRKRTEKRRSLPENHPHYLSDEGLARHQSSVGHPSAEDLDRGAAFLRNLLSS